MNLENIKIGFALTGSFCTFAKVIPKIKELKEKNTSAGFIMAGIFIAIAIVVRTVII